MSRGFAEGRSAPKIDPTTNTAAPKGQSIWLVLISKACNDSASREWMNSLR